MKTTKGNLPKQDPVFSSMARISKAILDSEKELGKRINSVMVVHGVPGSIIQVRLDMADQDAPDG